MKNTETPKEQKTDTSAEGGAEDIFDSIVSAHLGALDQIAAKIPPADTVTGAQLASAMDEIKLLVATVVASSITTSIASHVASMTAAAVVKAVTDCQAVGMQDMNDSVGTAVDSAMSKVLAALAEDRKQDTADRQSDQQAGQAERTAIMAALAKLGQPQKRTGTVMLPSGKVEMTVVTGGLQ